MKDKPVKVLLVDVDVQKLGQVLSCKLQMICSIPVAYETIYTGKPAEMVACAVQIQERSTWCLSDFNKQ